MPLWSTCLLKSMRICTPVCPQSPAVPQLIMWKASVCSHDGSSDDDSTQDGQQQPQPAAAAAANGPARGTAATKQAADGGAGEADASLDDQVSSALPCKIWEAAQRSCSKQASSTLDQLRGHPHATCIL